MNPFRRESKNILYSYTKSLVKKSLNILKPDNNSILFKPAAKMLRGLNTNIISRTSHILPSKTLGKMMSKSIKFAKSPIGFALGGLALTSMAIMHGAMNKMQEDLTGRYLRDQRQTSALMYKTRVGISGSRSINIGSHTGLSLGLSKSRHG